MPKLQRDALELIDKAWSARTITATRVAALARQLQADKKTIAAFDKEYELGQRSLIDLLNAQNQYFNAAVSLTSSRGVIVFADYQLLAAMGTLLEYLKAPPPVDAAPLESVPLGLIGYKLPDASRDAAADRLGAAAGCRRSNRCPRPGVSSYAAVEPQDGFTDRWPRWKFAARLIGVSQWFAEKSGSTPGARSRLRRSDRKSDAADGICRCGSGKPYWLLSAFPEREKAGTRTRIWDSAPPDRTRTC